LQFANMAGAQLVDAPLINTGLTVRASWNGEPNERDPYGCRPDRRNPERRASGGAILCNTIRTDGTFRNDDC